MAFACAPGVIGFVNRCVRRLVEVEKAQWKEDPKYAGEYRYALIILSLAFQAFLTLGTPLHTASMAAILTKFGRGFKLTEGRDSAGNISYRSMKRA